MSTLPLYRVTKADIPPAVQCLKDAFRDDPLWTVVFKDDPDKDKSLSGFFTCPLLYGMKFGTAYATSRDIEGVAAWVPGRYADMTMWRMLRCGALAYGAKMGRSTVRNLSIVSNKLGSDRKRLMKNKPYTYLTIIGVSPEAQGKGLGTKLMNTLTQECTKKGHYVYLETEKEENLPFYEKYGFTVLERVMLEELKVPMWEMVRKP